MAARVEALPVSMPGLCAVRWSIDELHVGFKERYTIARVESGCSEWSSGGKVWRSAPGSLQIQRPGDVCRDVSRDGPGACQIVSFSADAVERVVGKLRVHPSLDAGDERGAAFHRLHAAIRAGADRLALEVAVVEAIAAFAGVVEPRCTHTRPVRRAIELLHARLAEPLSLDDLAQHAALDKFHLCRAFRAQVGIAPHAYLMRLRVMHAKQLLARGAKPSEVAPAVGLYDQSQLNRHFRRLVGTTPRQYAQLASAGQT